MSKTIVITTTKQAQAMLEILAREEKTARVDNYATERARPIRRMTCTCCGAYYRGRQWWNQDTGFGLGDCCVKYCGVAPDGGESSCYGVPGIHFLIEQAKPEPEPQTTLEWAALWSAMREHYNAGSDVWTLTTQHMFNEMLGVLPPRAMSSGAFLVGEPETHDANGRAVYAAFRQLPGNVFQSRYMTANEFRSV